MQFKKTIASWLFWYENQNSKNFLLRLGMNLLQLQILAVQVFIFFVYELTLYMITYWYHLFLN